MDATTSSSSPDPCSPSLFKEAPWCRGRRLLIPLLPAFFFSCDPPVGKCLIYLLSVSFLAASWLVLWRTNSLFGRVLWPSIRSHTGQIFRVAVPSMRRTLGSPDPDWPADPSSPRSEGSPPKARPPCPLPSLFAFSSPPCHDGWCTLPDGFSRFMSIAKEDLPERVVYIKALSHAYSWEAPPSATDPLFNFTFFFSTTGANTTASCLWSSYVL